MNKIFKVIWNVETQSWVAVSELTKAKGKSTHTIDRRSEKTSGQISSLFAKHLIVFGFLYLGSSSSFAAINTSQTYNDNETGAIYGSNVRVAISSDTAQNTAAIANISMFGKNIDISQYVNASPGQSTSLRPYIGNPTNVSLLGRNINIGAGNEMVIMGNNLTIDHNGNLAESQLNPVVVAGSNQTIRNSGNYVTFGHNISINTNGYAFGTNVTAYRGSIVLGKDSASTNVASVVVGENVTSGSINSLFMGRDIRDFGWGTNAIAIGRALEVGKDGQTGGQNAIVIGQNSTVARNEGIAIGYSAKANGGYSAIAFGQNAVIDDGAGDYVTAIGGRSNIRSGSSYADAFGYNTSVKGSRSVAMGVDSNVTGETSLALLKSAVVGNNSAAILSSSVNGNKSLAIGNAITNGTESVAVGSNQNVTGQNSGAFGSTDTNNTATINANYAYSIGHKNQINSDKAMAFGNNITIATGNEGAVVLGESSAITHSAANESSATVNNVEYTGFQNSVGGNGYVVSIGNATARRQLINVAAGELSATSSDAVNGSQLFSVANKLSSTQLNFTVANGETASATSGNAQSWKVNGITQSVTFGAATDLAVTTDGAGKIVYDLATTTKTNISEANRIAKLANTTANDANVTANLLKQTQFGFSVTNGETAGSASTGSAKTWNVDGSTSQGITFGAASALAVSTDGAGKIVYDLSTTTKDTIQDANATAYAANATANLLKQTQFGFSVANSETAGSATTGSAKNWNVDGSTSQGIVFGATADLAVSTDSAGKIVYGLSATTLNDISEANRIANLANNTANTANNTANIANNTANTANNTANIANNTANTANNTANIANNTANTANNTANIANNTANTANNTANIANNTANTANNTANIANNTANTANNTANIANNTANTANNTANIANNTANTANNTANIANNTANTANNTANIANNTANTANNTANIANNTANTANNTANIANNTANTANNTANIANNTANTANNTANIANNTANTANNTANIANNTANTANSTVNEVKEKVKELTQRSEEMGNNSYTFKIENNIEQQAETAGVADEWTLKNADELLFGATKYLNVSTDRAGKVIYNLSSGVIFTLSKASAMLDTSAAGENATAVGPNSSASATNTTALGANATASGTNATATGQNAVASGENTTVNGQGSTASGQNSTAIGQGSTASGNNATTIGQNSTASGNNSTSGGQNSQATGENATAYGQNATASGDNSSAFGQNTTASGNNSSAFGQNAVSSGENSTASGQNSTASGSNSTASGQNSTASGSNSTASGQNSTASGENATAYGQNATASGKNSSAFGQNATSSGENATAIGQNAVASGLNSTANGQNAVASGRNATANGQNAVASGENATAVGQNSTASGKNSSTFGTNSVASAENSVAIGTNSVADRPNTISVGSVGKERAITNVADGTKDTDAVNVRQLRSSQQSLNNRIDGVEQRMKRETEKLRGGIASAAAVGLLPSATLSGKSVVGASATTYRGANAVAVGYAKTSDSGRVMIKIAGSANSEGNFLGGVSVGYQW